eukprot:jgi/Undpi1/11296/HiC_scaffold_30.g13594.m1
MERYRMDKVVGQGSFGQAILCARITDGKACIVKQVDTSKLPSKARREANKEATLLAKLSHPNIVGFWESFLHGPSGHMLCIVMDYADGGDLSTCLRKRNGRLLEEEVILDWFVQTTLALKHIHDRKILHRDLKTQNIFLTRSRVVKLGDFGIAKVLGSTFDLARTAIGTPFYMSPEICQEKRYNHKTDMWSLGCVLYEMTALRHAFDGSNMRQLAMKICAQDPRPISSRFVESAWMTYVQLRDAHSSTTVAQKGPPRQAKHRLSVTAAVDQGQDRTFSQRGAGTFGLWLALPGYVVTACRLPHVDWECVCAAWLTSLDVLVARVLSLVC